MIYYIQRVVSNLDTHSLSYVLDCTNIICKNSTDSLPTLIYNDVILTQTLKDVLVDIYNRGDLHEKTNDFLYIWSHRTDAQSYFSLYKILLEEQEKNDSCFYILQMFMPRLRSELEYEPGELWIYGSVDLIKDLALSIHSKSSMHKLSVLADLVKMLAQKMRMKNSEIIMISKCLTNHLMDMKGGLDANSIKVYRACMYVWISIIAQGKKDTFRTIYSIIVKLRVIFI